MLAEQIAAGRLAAYGATPALVVERAGLPSNIRGSLPVPWRISAEESA